MIERIDPKTLKQSVQQQNSADQYGVSSLFWNFYSPADDLLKPWGTKERDIQLRQYWYAVNNTLVQGAISNLIKRVVNTPWELSGGRNLTRRYQDMLQNAEFGNGWKDFLTKILTDYFTQDFGGVMEVIGAGQPDTPIRGGVVGLAQLDRQRCLATGDVRFPLVYYNDVIDTNGGRKTTIHRMHHTRVVRLVDMVSPIERSYGNGLCALSRVIGVTNAQILMGRYQNEKLSNAPPVGLITFGNVRPGDVDVFKQRYQADRQANGENTYAPIMEMQSVNPEHPIEVNFIPFAQVPDSFNYKEYMETHVNMLALGLGEDPQDIWPLTGGSFGTGTQSVILAKKGRAKAYADCLTMIERILNLWVLPESLEFAFKFNDSERDKEEAETAQAWMNVINAAPITPEQKLMMMANRIPAFADVLLDEAGNLRLPDDDVQEETTANDATALEAQAATDEAEEDTGAAEADSADADPGTKQLGRGRLMDRIGRRKEYADTRDDFIVGVSELIQSAEEGEMSRRSFSASLRGIIASYGKQAYKDGLKEGGVNDDLVPEDQIIITSIIAAQSQYISDLASTIYADGYLPNPDNHATMWANKTLEQFRSAGLMSADANGMYEFVGSDGTEGCRTCKRLKGQIHRLKEWKKKGLRPGVDTEAFECGGWQCQHFLQKTTERARGRW